MAGFLMSAALFILATAAVGLVRVLRGPSDADRMMSIQLLGAAGIAVLLLVGEAENPAGAIDLALILALLAALATIALVRSAAADPARRTPTVER